MVCNIFRLEMRPAGGFLADKIVFLAGKASRRDLLGGRSNFQKCFKSCFDSRCRIYAKICEDSPKKSLMFIHSTSSYGRNKFCIEFRSQCHIFGWYIDISLGESGAHEAPYVALLIRSIQRGLGESPGAGTTAAPLEVR